MKHFIICTYCSADFVRIAKSRKMRWVRPVTYMERYETSKNLVKRSKTKRLLEKIILRWVCRKYCVRVWTGLLWLTIGSCELVINFHVIPTSGNFFNS